MGLILKGHEEWDQNPQMLEYYVEFEIQLFE
jgi:hypothetical protein